jgi:predicted AlkP superfamily phosphohydrolase/phosphomutase/tetratricopeptide (TPR) repeat protein
MSRLLFVGWDAADWKIIDPLLAAGEMPHLASVIAGGARGNIATLYPALSPTLWTSIATGKRPFRHGIHGFTEPTGDGLGVREITNLGRTTKAFWNILNQNGKRPIVVGWWPSHPAEPIDGAMVSNQFPLKREVPPECPMPPETVWPPAWADRLADLRIHPTELTGEMLRMFVPRLDEIDQKRDRSLMDLAGIVAETMSVHNAATELMARADWDMAAVYYVGIDHFSHRFMRYHAGKARERDGLDPSLYTEVVRNGYRYHDVMLGRLLALAGPDTSVMLASDHGFHSDRLLPDYIPAEAAGPAVEHRHFGVVCLRAPGVPAGGRIHGASVLDIAPTILHLFGLPAGEDMDGKVLASAFENPSVPPRIPSWDEVPGRDGRHSAGRAYDSAASVESLQQLVDLGYISPPDADAAKAVRQCLTENQYNLARAFEDGGQFSSGAPILERLLAEEPEEGRFYRELFHCRLAQGDRAAARAVLDRFDRACAEFVPRAQEELKKRIAEERTKAEEAKPEEGANDPERRRRAHLTQRLAEKASGFVAERLLMRCRLALGNLRSPARKSAAAAVLEQLASASGRILGFSYFLAEGFAAVGQYDRALSYVRRLRRADKDDWRAMALEARIHHAEGRHEEVIACAAESLLRVYFQPNVHLLLAQGLFRLGELARAEESVRVALAQMPELAPAHALLGRILRRDRARIGEASLHMAKAEVLRKRRSAKKPVPAAADTVSGGLPSLERWDGDPPPERSETITVVTGLPRSGTSMMMQMLVAGGVTPYTDGRRQADEDNPRGYFEHEDAARLHRETAWIPQARGKVVKVVAHLLPYLPSGQRYRVVFLHRKMEDVIASQSAMLTRLGRGGARLTSAALQRAYTRQLLEVQRWIQRTPGIEVIAIGYETALADPQGAGARLANFVGEPFDAEAAARAVEPVLRRQGLAPALG